MRHNARITRRPATTYWSAGLGALPARFRRERVLIIGCGDVGQRVARVLGGGRRVRLLALTSSADRAGHLRAQGITPLLGNLDDFHSLGRLAGLATRVLRTRFSAGSPASLVGSDKGEILAVLRAPAGRGRTMGRNQ